jgi:hypothetical protein
MKGQTPATTLALSSQEAFALLDVRPARWLAPFLRLATHPVAGATAAYADADHWYRLRPPRRGLDGVVRARLVWRPHLGDLVFRWFRGELCVAPRGGRTVLSIEGEMEGGDARANLAVLDELARLIAQAASGRQSLDG